jgi:hypothetical protein
MAIGLITYQDASRREDLIDVVSNVSPSETPLLSGLPMGSPATNTLHQYPTDTFSTYNVNAQVEASSFTAVDLTSPVRATNICQIFIQAVQVSETEIAVKGVVEPYSYQLQKNLIQHATDKLLNVGLKLSYIGETLLQYTRYMLQLACYGKGNTEERYFA